MSQDKPLFERIARARQLWVNKSDRDQTGAITRDRRHEIVLHGLL
jgi:hypothetical protein